MPSRDANGRALPAFLRFYAPGTSTSTPKTVYADEALTVAHPFPLPSDSGGRYPQIWADEAEYFDVAWSDQTFDALISGFTDIRPLDDALLASASLAQDAAGQAEEAKDATVAIAAKFGDVDAAISAAQSAQDGAENAATAAATILNGPGGVVALRDQTQALRDETLEFRNQAEAIVGFDPANVVRVDAVQAFDATKKAQGRANIDAQPLVGVFDREKVQTVNVVAGVVTANLADGSVIVVNWTANITSLVITGVPAGTDNTSASLILKANGGATFAPGAPFKPANNVNPTLSTTVGDENNLTLATRNAGGRWDMFFAGFIRP